MSDEFKAHGASHKSHLPGLDGIRALAIGFVLLAHCIPYNTTNTALGKLSYVAGRSGVTIFFVLSGFLITSLLLREEEQTGGISLRLFYIRRALRLFPALWVYLLAVATIWHIDGKPQHSWEDILYSLFYIRNFIGSSYLTAHLWSLSIEEQFYLLWPLILIGLPRRNRTRLCIVAALLSAVTFWRIYAETTGLVLGWALASRSDFRSDAPLFGCALALLLRVVPQSVNWLNSSSPRSTFLAFTGLAGLVAWVGLDLDLLTSTKIEFTVVSIFAMMLIVSQIGVKGYGSRLLAWPPLVLIGQVSYGLYLWQQIFLLPQSHGFSYGLPYPVALLMTFGVTGISYWCLEKPLLRLKDRKFHKSARDSVHSNRSASSVQEAGYSGQPPRLAT